MYVPEITIVKEHLDGLKASGIISEWELPYENLLTRRSASIFFISLTDKADITKVWNEFEKYENFSYRYNNEKKISGLDYRVTFNEEEKAKMAEMVQHV